MFGDRVLASLPNKLWSCGTSPGVVQGIMFHFHDSYEDEMCRKFSRAKNQAFHKLSQTCWNFFQCDKFSKHALEWRRTCLNFHNHWLESSLCEKKTKKNRSLNIQYPWSPLLSWFWNHTSLLGVIFFFRVACFAVEEISTQSPFALFLVEQSLFRNLGRWVLKKTSANMVYSKKQKTSTNKNTPSPSPF